MKKVIKIHFENQKIIEKAKQNDRLAQKQLYESYAPAMLSVCMLYINDLHFAEDVLLKSFFKIFTHLKNYQEQHHFYAWIRRIVVNECIDFLKSKMQKMSFSELKNDYDEADLWYEDELLNEDELQSLIDELPEGCRAIFNLYVFEDYSHNQICEELNISLGTSKSQLSYAKKILKQKIEKQQTLKNKSI